MGSNWYPQYLATLSIRNNLRRLDKNRLVIVVLSLACNVSAHAVSNTRCSVEQTKMTNTILFVRSLVNAYTLKMATH